VHSMLHIMMPLTMQYSLASCCWSCLRYKYSPQPLVLTY